MPAPSSSKTAGRARFPTMIAAWQRRLNNFCWKIVPLRSMKNCLLISIMLAALGGAAYAGELAVLRNGFTIHHERREVRGEITRLYLEGGDHSSYIDVPSSEIVSFALDPDAPAAAAKVATVQDSVDSASRQTGLDPEFINSVIRAESAFNPRAVSDKGAQGLMQLMPAT